MLRKNMFLDFCFCEERKEGFVFFFFLIVLRHATIIFRRDLQWKYSDKPSYFDTKGTHGANMLVLILK